MNGKTPAAGALTNRPGGVIIPNKFSGGILSTNPIGGQFGPDIVGGTQSPNNQLKVTGSGVLVGGAPQVNPPPGGALTNTGFGQLH
jgi:hypothetical protein